jgi:hypothetical protein
MIGNQVVGIAPGSLPGSIDEHPGVGPELGGPAGGDNIIMVDTVLGINSLIRLPTRAPRVYLNQTFNSLSALKAHVLKFAKENEFTIRITAELTDSKRTPRVCLKGLLEC